MLLALDQSPTHTGWAYGDVASARPVFGCQEHGDFGNDDRRLQRDVKKWLMQLCKSTGITVICFEELIIGDSQKPSLDKKYAVIAAFNEVSMDLDIDLYDTNIGAWRKHFIGAGRGPNRKSTNTDWFKEQAVIACARRNWFTENHHAAEACGIWDYSMWKHYPSYRHKNGPAKRRADSAADEARRSA